MIISYDLVWHSAAAKSSLMMGKFTLFIVTFRRTPVCHVKAHMFVDCTQAQRDVLVKKSRIFGARSFSRPSTRPSSSNGMKCIDLAFA